MSRARYSFVIPYRAQHRERSNNLHYVLDWFSRLRDTELLLVEQGPAPSLESDELDHTVSYAFIFNPGPFNKSWAFNVGAIQAVGTVLALGDADLLVDTDVVQACLEKCVDDFEAINPYSHLIDLTQNQTERVLGGEPLPGPEGQQVDRDYKGEYLCFCGGLYVINRSAYLRLGGQDERFVGWGGEDDAMSVKVGLLDRVAVNNSGLAYHLYHPAASDSVAGAPEYSENMRLLGDYRRMSPRQLEALCGNQVPFGDPNKYRRSAG